MNYPIGQINHSYLGSSVYTMLREALITGQLKPDDRLRIRELAAQVGTSVTPVRDAILQLAKEQALVLKTPRDIRVPQLTEAQFIEIRTLRLALEGTGAEQAAAHITPKMLEQIEENIRQNRLAIDEKNLREALRLNSEFHLFLAQAARMPLLTPFYRQPVDAHRPANCAGLCAFFCADGDRTSRRGLRGTTAARCQRRSTGYPIRYSGRQRNDAGLYCHRPIACRGSITLRRDEPW